MYIYNYMYISVYAHASFYLLPLRQPSLEVSLDCVSLKSLGRKQKLRLWRSKLLILPVCELRLPRGTVIQHSFDMENHQLFNGKFHYQCSFSIAILHYHKISIGTGDFHISFSFPCMYLLISVLLTQMI